MAQAAQVTDPATGDPSTPSPKDKSKRKQDCLFGPNIGVVSSGPAWTNVVEKKVSSDELTPDVVKGWIEKTKQTAQPTTTLQALVNLKRPTIRLSPLQTQDAEDSSQPDLHQQHYHGLEFEYDCDAPKCGIYVHVLVSPDHPDASTNFSSGLTKITVFESVTSGGFGKTLKLEEGAMLELSRFERTPGGSAPSHPTSDNKAADGDNSANAEGDGVNGGTSGNRARKRFTTFAFRKRTHAPNHSVSGPALAVVDADPQSEDKVKGKDEEEGVRVIIRLVALDEQGTELSSLNEQVTYLHVVRFGAPSTDREPDEEDARPWVVKVVKREATIGPHTFHLHEIYGLSSHPTHTSVPTAPLPSSGHTYPPTEEPAAEAAPTAEDEPSSECLLCLSSPREVVLLPCRHLVACKECALNMVEFGAGGNIVHAEEPAEGGDTPADTSNAEGDGSSPAALNPAPTPAPVTTRRKRKAKGWFCPVCRQPYTSLLRITTMPPPAETKDEIAGDPLNATATAAEVSPPPAVTASTRLGGFRPGFLRTFSRNPPPDLERGEGTGPAPTAQSIEAR